MVWRNAFSHVVHKLLLFAAIAIFLWACFLGVLRLSLPFLVSHSEFLISSISSAVGVPLQVGQLKASWHGIRPVIQLSNVTVLDDKQRSSVFLPQVSVEVDVAQSLWYRQLEIQLLQITDWHLRAYQTAQGQWLVNGLNNKTDNAESDIALNKVLAVLVGIHHLQLVEGQIALTPYQKPKVTGNHINLDWYSRHGKLAFYGNLNILSPDIKQIRFAAQFRSAKQPINLNQLSGRFYLQSDDFDPSLVLSETPWFKEWSWQHGVMKGELWGEWAENKVTRIQTALQLKNIKLMKKSALLPEGMDVNSGQLNVVFSSNDQRQAQFNFMAQGAVFYSGKLFRKPLPLTQVNIQGRSFQQDKNYIVEVGDAKLQMPDADIQAKLQLRFNSNQSPEMSLLAHTNFYNLPNVFTYLPAGIMSPKVVDWLDKSVSHLTKITANMAWRGPLKQFPFKDQSGTMVIDGHITDAKLDFAPGWPTITGLDTDLYVNSHGMHIETQRGLLDHVAIGNGVIADIPFVSQSHLTISGSIQDDLSNAWGFLKKAPFAQKWRAALDASAAKGPFHVDIKLDVPLYETQQAPIYHGTAQFVTADQINLLPTVALSNVQGQLDFSNTKWASHNLQANLLGQLWAIDVSRQNADIPVAVKAQGKLDLEKAKASFEVPDWATLQGITPLDLAIQVPSDNSPLQWTLTTSLQGAALSLPLGYSKEAKQQTPLIFSGSQSKAGNDLNVTWQAPQGQVQLNKTGFTWNIQSPFITGSVIQAQNDITPWQIALTTLDLRNIAKHEKTNVVLKKLPPLDLSIAKAITSDNSIFSLSLSLRPNTYGTTIQQLTLRHQEYSMTAVGKMTPERTLIKGTLTSKNLANTLQAFKVPNILNAQDANFGFQLSWPGQLWDLDRSQLQGAINVNVGPGIFTDISESTNNSLNLGRLLNILSVSNLPNLKSFGQKGFQFSKMSGDLSLQPNRINKLNLTINGVLANATLQGCINIEKQQLNLAADINPHLTSSVPVIAAIAGGPVAGAVGFIAEKLISPAVGSITAINYIIKGNWQNPQTMKTNSATAKQQLALCPI